MGSIRPKVIARIVQAFKDAADVNSGYLLEHLSIKPTSIRPSILGLETHDIRRLELPLIDVIDDRETERSLLFGQKTSTYKLEPIIRLVFVVAEPPATNPNFQYEEVVRHMQAFKEVHARNANLSLSAEGSALWHMPVIQTVSDDRESLVQIASNNAIIVEDQEIFK